MNMLNSVILEGNIESVGQLKRDAQNILQLDVSISVERSYKNREGKSVDDTSVFDIISYGNVAEILSHHCDKGQGIRVVGRLKMLKWFDREKKCSRIVIVAEHIEFKPFIKKETENEKPVF